MPDLHTPEGFITWLDWVKTRCSTAIAKKGTMCATGYVICTRDPISKSDYPPESSPVIHALKAVSFANQGEKQAFFRALAGCAAAGHALGYAFTAEAWMAKVDAKPDVDLEVQARELLANMPGGVKDHPERMECVMLIASHREWSPDDLRNWSAPIIRGSKAVRLASWEEQSSAILSGNMFSINDLATHPEW